MTKKEKTKEFLMCANAILDSMNSILNTDNPKDVWRFSNYHVYMRKYNHLVKQTSKHIKIDTIVDYFDLQKTPSPYNTIAIAQKSFFTAVYTNLLILKSYLENKLDLKKDEISNLINFLHSKLRAAIFELPKKEKDIQNAIEQLFIGKGLSKGIDYDREVGRVKVSTKETIPDFILPKLDLALEIKFSSSKEKSKAIVDEINADIQAYSKHYSILLFLVYDMGFIRDENEFKNDLDNSSNINVIVVKH